MDMGNLTNEEINQYSNLGANARPDDIRTAQRILNSQRESQREILNNNLSNANIDVDALEKMFSEIKKNIENLKENNKEAAQANKNLIESLQLEKALKKLRQDEAGVLEKANKVQKDTAASLSSIINAADDVDELSTNAQVLQAIFRELSNVSGEYNTTLKDSVKLQKANIQADRQERAEANRNRVTQAKGLENTGGQSLPKAMAKEWKEIGSQLRSIIDTININRLAQEFAPSSRQTLQQDIQTNFGINRKEFQSFKKDLFNSVDQQIYSSEDIMDAMKTLSSSTIENTETATKYFEDIVRGQKVLGMSSATQETLLRLGNVTGRNELKFYTNQVAKFQQSSLGLSKKQLDELVSLNASLQMQAADIGIATDEFRQMSSTEQAALEATNAGFGSKYTQMTSNLLANTDTTAALLGMDSGELSQRLARGESLIDLLRNSGAGSRAAINVLKGGDEAEITRYFEHAKSAWGIDENTWSVLRVIAQQEQELNKNLKTATKAANEQKDAAKEQEEKYGESLTGIQKFINGIQNWWNGNMNWTELEYLRSIETTVKAIAVILGAQSVFGSLGQVLGLGGKGGLLSKIGAGKGLAGLTVGHASGLAALGGIGLIAGGGIAGISDAFTMSNAKNGGALRGLFLGTGRNELSQEDNNKAVARNGLKWGAVGAGIGTLIAPGVGTLIGGGIGILAGIIGGAVGAGMDAGMEKSEEELEEIRKNTQATADNTSYKGIGMVYRYRGVSNYSSMSGGPTGIGDASYPVSSHYGPRGRFKTSNGNWTNSFHSGTDYAAPEGTPLFSNVTGTVAAVGKDGAGANYVGVTDDKTGYTHWYWHMMKPASVSKGAHITKGTPVGFVGQTGNATGPHLHYTVTKPNRLDWWNAQESTVDSLPFATSSIFNGSSSSLVSSDGGKLDMSNLYHTETTRVNLNRLGDTSNPIVNSIADLKNTIINLSEQTSRNQKIMDALVNRTMQSPTV